MTDDENPRRPFGERGEEERAPFGSRPPGAARERRERPQRWREEPISVETLPEPPVAEVEAGEEDDEPIVEATDEDLPLEDEPETAPLHIRARGRRGQIRAGRSFLKRTPARPEDEEEDEPEPEPYTGPPVGLRFGVLLRTMGIVMGVAALIATVFTWWTPNVFLPTESIEQISMALATQSGLEALEALPTRPPTATPLPPLPDRIGIVSGHRGIHPQSGIEDPGAVCDDGLTEREINEAAATRVVDWLTQHGYEVDLFDEFDPRLEGYRARVLVSIHADTCEYINEFATGFKVASFAESSTPDEDARLVACLINRYGDTTGLSFHPSVTFDMTQYHNFREISPGTVGAIVEVGFMNLDRELLQNSPDVVALGVARGILCYLRNEPLSAEEPPPTESVIETGTPVP